MGQEFAPTQDFQRGLSRTALGQPHVKRLCAFCSIDDKIFATSDGSCVSFWDERGIDTKLKLPAIALTYVRQLQQIVAYVKESTHLHFIHLRKPYTSRPHPSPFSGKAVSSMAFFAGPGVLVSAGQGLLISRMTLPGNRAATGLIEFSRIAELHTDEVFTFVNTPLYVESRGLVVLAIRNSLFIYACEGRLIKRLDRSADIGSLSFDEEKQLIVVSTCDGRFSFVEPSPLFTESSVAIVRGVHIIHARPFDGCPYLPVAADKGRQSIGKSRHV
jgi:hypothetical protein